MTARTLWRLARDGRLGVLLAVGRLQVPFYRLVFLAAALRAGLLARLAAGAIPFDALAAEMTAGTAGRDGLRAFLELGTRVGVLRAGRDGYRLRGRLARRLARPAHDASAALVEETATLHHRVVLETPARLGAGRLFSLDDQDGDVVARSSRSLEEIVREAVERVVPARGTVHLLEIGCGTGVHVAHAARRNPGLTALAVELQPAVAELARRPLAARVTVDVGDVRARAPEAVFDVATLHNNAYYFTVDERPALFAHVRRFLRPGGRLLVTTACGGGTAAMEMLGLWAAMTAGCGRLPSPDELERQLAEAGFVRTSRRSLIPGDRYYAFVAEA
jgi:4-hydroxy-2,2'-bipyrrole-5-carbaldehyde O-methyltransferase